MSLLDFTTRPQTTLNHGNSFASRAWGVWDFREGAGSEAHDLMGRNDGTFSGSPQWRSEYQVGINLTGTEYVDVGTMGNFGSSMADGFSCLMVFRNDTTGASYRQIFGVYNDGSNTNLGLFLNFNDASGAKVFLENRDDDANAFHANWGASTSPSIAGLTGIHAMAINVLPSTNETDLAIDGVLQQNKSVTLAQSPSNFANFAYSMTLGVGNYRDSYSYHIDGALFLVGFSRALLSAAALVDLTRDPWQIYENPPLKGLAPSFAPISAGGGGSSAFPLLLLGGS